MSTPGVVEGASRAVAAELVVRSVSAGEGRSRARAVTELTLDPAELVFQGHYPGFPIFPGVCLIECAHRSAVAAFGDHLGAAQLAAVESARFTGPAYPGDVLTFEAELRGGDDWQVRVTARTPRGESARIRLRYPGGTP
jgi:3-hydroxyacyl-[acyl-carrier-protein] dehydratase